MADRVTQDASSQANTGAGATSIVSEQSPLLARSESSAVSEAEGFSTFPSSENSTAVSTVESSDEEALIGSTPVGDGVAEEPPLSHAVILRIILILIIGQ